MYFFLIIYLIEFGISFDGIFYLKTLALIGMQYLCGIAFRNMRDNKHAFVIFGWHS
jgi:hypothetical protein